MLRTLVILASLLLAISARLTTIKSPCVTNWGRWAGMSRCPSGQFVRGFRVKYEDHAYWDRTGINGIELVFQDSNQVDKYIKSGESPNGDWKYFNYCPAGGPKLI